LGKHELKWPPHEKEAYAVVWAVKHFRTYLTGHPFKVVTDCSALKVFTQGRSENQRVERWADSLQKYTFEVTHRPGKQHVNADFLSRLSGIGVDPNPPPDNVIALIADFNQLIQAQNADPAIKSIFQFKMEGEHSVSRDYLLFARKWDEKTEIQDGIL